jgi:hypothetical protein
MVQYLGFLVAVLILIWAAIEIGRRYYRREKIHNRAPNTWAKLDTTRARALEEEAPEAINEDEEDASEQSLHTRAQQNGHHLESKKP